MKCRSSFGNRRTDDLRNDWLLATDQRHRIHLCLTYSLQMMIAYTLTAYACWRPRWTTWET